jgi:hypothetical protein
MRSAGEHMLWILGGRLGCAEDPPGSNNGECVREAQKYTWLPVPRPGRQGWPWCVAEFQRTVKTGFGAAYPRLTAECGDLARDARARRITIPVSMAEPGDWAILGAEHITCFKTIDRGAGLFVGRGGNQRDAVRDSEYPLSRVTTVIDSDALGRMLGWHQGPFEPPKPPRVKPVFQVVRGDGEEARVVFTSKTLDGATAFLEGLIRRGATGAGIRKRKP